MTKVLREKSDNGQRDCKCDENLLRALKHSMQSEYKRKIDCGGL